MNIKDANRSVKAKSATIYFISFYESKISINVMNHIFSCIGMTGVV